MTEDKCPVCGSECRLKEFAGWLNSTELNRLKPLLILFIKAHRIAIEQKAQISMLKIIKHEQDKEIERLKGAHVYIPVRGWDDDA